MRGEGTCIPHDHRLQGSKKGAPYDMNLILTFFKYSFPLGQQHKEMKQKLFPC